jgi:sphingomyelin phosphodiesterase acid-like 3
MRERRCSIRRFATFTNAKARENKMNGHSNQSGDGPDNCESTKPGGGISRRDFVKYSAGTVACIYLGALNSGCGGGSNTTGSNFPVAVFSDVHFNPFYDPNLVTALVNENDTGKWAGIFQTSALGPSSRGGDTNYPLLVLALSGIQQNLGASPLIIFTGDILGHGLPQMFYLHLNGTENPRDLADVAAMKAFTDKVVAFFMGQVRGAVGNVPVMFAVGNGDSYSGAGPNVLDSSTFAPDNSFLVNTADLFYTKFLNGTVDHQGFLDTFTTAGYYSAEPAGTNLMVIGLNTILFCRDFSSGQDANDGIVAAELDWLDSRLAAAEVKGKKVWLLMHAPPGADIATTAKPANFDSNGHIATATMIWWTAYQASFLAILAKYPGIISLTLAGHTHMDEYRILPSSGAVEITPAISPWFGNNPAFKVFTISLDTLKPTDYSSLNYDLAINPPQFNSYYTFSTAYSSQGLLGESLTQLTPALVTNPDKQKLYRGHYYSGNKSLTPVTYPPFGNSYSPIADTTWPVYWSGIGHMEQQAIIDAVNSY